MISLYLHEYLNFISFHRYWKRLSEKSKSFILLQRDYLIWLNIPTAFLCVLIPFDVYIFWVAFPFPLIHTKGFM